MKEEVKRWWQSALKDLDTAKANFEIKKYSYSAFLCQQAAEKALKSLDLKLSGKIIKTHDLVFLGRRVKAPTILLEKCGKINPVYTDSRYPDFSTKEVYTREKVEELLTYSKEVLEWVKLQLNI